MFWCSGRLGGAHEQLAAFAVCPVRQRPHIVVHPSDERRADRLQRCRLLLAGPADHPGRTDVRRQQLRSDCRRVREDPPFLGSHTGRLRSGGRRDAADSVDLRVPRRRADERGDGLGKVGRVLRPGHRLRDPAGRTRPLRQQSCGNPLDAAHARREHQPCRSRLRSRDTGRQRRWRDHHLLEHVAPRDVHRCAFRRRRFAACCCPGSRD